MSTHTSKKAEHEVKGAVADTKKEVHKEQAKDPYATTGTKVKAAAKVPGDKAEAEAHKNHPATSDHSSDHTSKHSTDHTSKHSGDHHKNSKHDVEIKGDHTSKTSVKTTTKDGTKIEVEGAGPTVPSMVSPPSNKQIDSVLTGAHHDLEKQKPHLDSHGKEIASSTQNVIDATSLLLNEKNKEQRFQRLFLYTQGTAKGSTTDGLASAAKTFMTQTTGMGSKISNDATDVLGYVRETILNVTTNAEYRQLLIEFLNLLQSLMGQLQTQVAKTDSNEPLKGSKLKAQVYENEEDRLEDINEKLTAFLKRVGKNPQYKSVITNFMKYSEEIYDALYKAKSEANTTKESENLRKTLDEGWEILNDFVGDDKLVPKFKKNLTSMLEKIRKDEELTVWLKECKKHLTELMDHPENAKKDQKQTEKLIKTGEGLTDKYRGDLNRLYSESRRIVDKIQSDPVVLNFQQNLERLGRDIALNSKGQPDLFVLEKSLNTIRDLLVERFKNVLVDVPIERVHIQNDSMDVTLKSITIKGSGLVPNNLHVEMSSISDINLERTADAAQKWRLRLRVDEIKPHFKGVKFAYKKTSFPSMKDKGIADIIFEGKGLSVDVALQFVTASNKISKAIIENITVDIERVNLKIEEAKHDILSAMFTPMIQSRLRTKMQTGIYEFINGRLTEVVGQLNRWFKTKPFETMMVKGNETLQTTLEKKEEVKVDAKIQKEKTKKKVEEGKKELTAEEKQKKKEKKEMKLQQQNVAGAAVYQSGADAYQHQPAHMGHNNIQYNQQPMVDQQQPMMGQQQHPMGQQQMPAAYQHEPAHMGHNNIQYNQQPMVASNPMMNQHQSHGQQQPQQSGAAWNDFQQPIHQQHPQQLQHPTTSGGLPHPTAGLNTQQPKVSDFEIQQQNPSDFQRLPHAGQHGEGSPRGAMKQQDAHLPSTAVAHQPTAAKTGQQTQEHFVHPPADYQPNQQHGHQSDSAQVDRVNSGQVDRMTKVLDPNVNQHQVKEQPSS